MKNLFYDVETTGLSRSSDILSIAIITCDENLNLVDVYNEYFLYGDEVPSSAAAVHGLTRQKLEFLATREFIDAAPEIYDIITEPGVQLVGHNITKYDNSVLQHNLAASGFSVDVGAIPAIDTLALAKAKFNGSHKLSDCVSTLTAEAGLPEDFVYELFDCSKCLQEHVIDKSKKYHSALFDTFCSHYIYTLMRELWD